MYRFTAGSGFACGPYSPILPVSHEKNDANRRVIGNNGNDDNNNDDETTFSE